MIDGKPYRTLRRHLASSGLTPDDYRQRYGLRADYPMVAPAYSESRSALAKTIGLGRKRTADATTAADTADSEVGADAEWERRRCESFPVRSHTASW
jgi:predicted transcriptional regulator